MLKKALVIVAHPHLGQSVANRQIVESLGVHENIMVHNLYDLYPYFHIDVKKEQKLLIEHDVIVMQHPFFWYNMPPLLKLWMDEVLTLGFAYGDKGEALKNKKFILSITTGGDPFAYSDKGHNGFAVEQFLYSYRQTCSLCQMNWNEPFILYSSRKTHMDDIRSHAAKLKNTILTQLGAHVGPQ